MTAQLIVDGELRVVQCVRDHEAERRAIDDIELHRSTRQ